MILFILALIIAIWIGIEERDIMQGIGAAFIGAFVAFMICLLIGGIAIDCDYTAELQKTYPLYATEETYVQHDGDNFNFIAIDENGFYKSYSEPYATIIYSEGEPSVAIYRKEVQSKFLRLISITVEDPIYQLYVPKDSVGFVEAPLVSGN